MGVKEILAARDAVADCERRIVDSFDRATALLNGEAEPVCYTCGGEGLISSSSLITEGGNLPSGGFYDVDVKPCPDCQLLNEARRLSKHND